MSLDDPDAGEPRPPAAQEPAPLRILQLEDSADDAALALRQLRRAGMVFVSQRVETQSAFVAALEAFRPDVILADYRLPEFDGKSALLLALKLHPHIPVIVVSGVLNDEEAVELLKAGARDFVLKDRLGRLAAAVRYAAEHRVERRLREHAERRVAESDARLRAAHEQLETALEGVDAGIWNIDLATQTMTWDAVGRRQYGLREGEPTPDLTSWLQRLHAEDRPRVMAAIEAAKRPGNERWDVEYRQQRPDGATRWFHSFGRIVRDAGGAVRSAHGISVDVTDARQTQHEKDRANDALELSRKRLDTLIANVSDVIVIATAVGAVQFVSEAIRPLTGYDPRIFIGRNYMEWVHLDDHPRAVSRWRELLQNPERHKRDDYRIRHADGRWLDVEVITHNLLAEPAVAGIVLVVRDITERNRIDAELRWRTAYFQSLIENSADGILAVDDKGKKVFQNQRAVELWKIPRAVAESPDDSQQRQVVMERTVDPKAFLDKVLHLYAHPTESSQDIVELKDGTILDRYSAPVPPYGRLWSFRDVTASRAAERALRESEERFRAIFDHAYDGILVMDIESRCARFANASMECLLAYLPGEMVGQHLSAMNPQAWRANASDLFDGAASGAVNDASDVPMLTKDGQTLYMDLAVTPVKIDGRDCLLCSFRDATGRRAGAEKLRLSLEGAIGAIGATMEARDPYTAGHQHRVGELGAAIATEMGLSSHTIEGIRFGGLIHDVGKIQVPSEILSKPTRLTKLEFDMIKIHPQAGYDIIKGIDFPWPVALMVLQHHERLDGSGYPQGLKGEQIIPEAQILAVADVVEAMSTHRPYRPALGLDAALQEIEGKKAVWYDPRAVDACLRLFRSKGFTW